MLTRRLADFSFGGLMLISPVIQAIRERCPMLEGRVVGAIDWEAARMSTSMRLPHAFVLPTGDKTERNDVQSGYRQSVDDTFDVVVLVRNEDERGQAAGDVIHFLRAELCRALAGWAPPGMEPIQYGGGDLIEIDRARLFYRFSWSAEWQLGGNGPGDPPETWPEWEQDGLPEFAGVHYGIDVVDPIVDPNIPPVTDPAQGGYRGGRPGPDGRIEFKLEDNDVPPQTD